MSSFNVPITTIREIQVHPNATALEVAKVYDWNVVVRKGEYKAGDNVVYVPVDSLLPQNLEDKLFPPGSKITLNKHRVRSIKIRGQISQGMIISMDDVQDELAPFQKEWHYGSDIDVSTFLGITKYEPPINEIPSHMKVKSKKKGNPAFKKYTDIENFKYYDRLFQDYEHVYVSEKLHGTSFRAGWFPMQADTIWKKIKKFLGVLPKWEFCWGSRTIQVQVKGSHGGYYNPNQGVDFGDVYTKMVKQYDLKKRIPKGFALYGEIVGSGIQKGYTYGCAEGEHKLYIYDVLDTIDNTWLDYFKENSDKPLFPLLVYEMGLERVPELYVGPFNRNLIDAFRDGPSTLGDQSVREGIVVKPMIEKTSSIGRKVLKYISEAYYLKNQEDGTDFH